MPYVIARPAGAWEIRESHATPSGPRSRTLATFRTLTPESIERAAARASKPLDPRELRRAAERAGAPVASSPPDRAAGELLADLAAGKQPRPALRRLLLDALADGRRDGATDSARAAAAWVAASARQRGEALHDLLLLADRLPAGDVRAGRATRRRAFPRIESRPV